MAASSCYDAYPVIGMDWQWCDQKHQVYPGTEAYQQAIWMLCLLLEKCHRSKGFFPQKTQIGPPNATLLMLSAFLMLTFISIPNFQFTGISLILSSLLKIIVHKTGMPVPEMKGRMVKCRSVVAPVGAVASPLF